MWFRLEAPAMSASPREVAEELAWIAYRLRSSLEVPGSYDARGIGVILDVNGTDMVAYGTEIATGVRTEAARAFKLWEQIREVPPAPEKRPYTTPKLTDYKLVSPRCGTCEHTAPHFQAAGQDACTETDADGTRRCGCENYVAEFDLPRVVVDWSKAPAGNELLLDLEVGKLNRMK